MTPLNEAPATCLCPALAAVTMALFAALGLVTGVAADWPQWRGPNRNGVSAESGWRDRWPDNGPPIAWKAEVGLGFSSFVVSEGRVYTMGHANETDSVFCFDAENGKALWKYSYPAELGDKYFDGGTTGTPTLETSRGTSGAGQRVYTLSRWGDVFCFEAATGKVLWKKNVQKETGVRIPDWGFTGAPLVHEDLLVLNVGEGGMALKKTTGEIIWKSANKDAGYSTPLPIERNSQWLGLIGSSESYLAVHLKTGKEAWRVRWLTQYGVNAADPVVSGDHLFISTGYGKGAALLKLGSGKPEAVWQTKVLRTQLNAAVLFADHLYGMDGDTTDKTPLKCLEFATGREKWSEPGIGTGGLIVADGRLIILSAQGELIVAPASSQAFKETARAPVLGGKCWTAPVLANGRIYCRNSRGEVVCVDVRE